MTADRLIFSLILATVIGVAVGWGLSQREYNKFLFQEAKDNADVLRGIATWITKAEKSEVVRPEEMELRRRKRQ